MLSIIPEPSQWSPSDMGRGGGCSPQLQGEKQTPGRLSDFPK